MELKERDEVQLLKERVELKGMCGFEGRKGIYRVGEREKSGVEVWEIHS